MNKPEKPANDNTKLVELIGSLASWLAPLLVYISSLAPCVTAGDAGEFIVAVQRFGLPHAPGYPLYMLLLKIWSAVPISLGADPLAVKCNLFSAVTMAIACWLFYKLARTLTGSAAASLGATLLLAFSRTFWKFAVVTEVYSLNVLLIVLLLLGLAIAREGKKPVGLVIAALAFGLGLTHHQTILFMVPFLIFLWPKGKFDSPVPVVGIVVAFILPLIFYLFLPVFAGNTPGYEDGFTTGSFVDYVTRAEYRQRPELQELPPDQLIGPPDVLNRVAQYLPRQFGWIILVLGFAGWFMAPAGKRAWGLWGGLTAVLWILMIGYFSRGAPLGMPFNFLRSVDEFLIPLNIFLALGLAFLFRLLSHELESQKDFGGTEGQNLIPPQYISLFIMLLLCVLALFVGVNNDLYSNMSHHTFAQDQSRNVLSQVPEDGVLVVSGDESFMFEYLQEVRGVRPDVELVVYPFRMTIGDVQYNTVDSLAAYLDLSLEDRDVLFTFSDASLAVNQLDPPKALSLEGVALRMIDREEGMSPIISGHPDAWLAYQLRNLDPETVNSLIFDDFEYEVVDRYINCLRSSVAWLDSNGYEGDRSRIAFNEMANALETVLQETHYPGAPETGAGGSE